MIATEFLSPASFMAVSIFVELCRNVYLLLPILINHGKYKSLHCNSGYDIMINTPSVGIL